MINWVEQLCLGEKPVNVIDPTLYFYNLKILISVSSYKGFNCFILDFPSATGKNIDLGKESNFGSLQLMKRHFGVLNSENKVVVVKEDEEKKEVVYSYFELVL